MLGTSYDPIIFFIELANAPGNLIFVTIVMNSKYFRRHSWSWHPALVMQVQLTGFSVIMFFLALLVN